MRSLSTEYALRVKDSLLARPESPLSSGEEFVQERSGDVGAFELSQVPAVR